MPVYVAFGHAAPPAQAPTVTTQAATQVGQTASTLRGLVVPGGATTTAWFEWGTSPTLTTFTATAPVLLQSVADAAQVTRQISNLTQNTTYYFRVAAQNSEGTTKGSILSFQTAQAPVQLAPTVSTGTATSITTGSANLNGTINPNGQTTSAWFEYGTTPSLTSFSSTPPQSVGGGTSELAFQQSSGGLQSNTTYYFRVAAQNATGTTKGQIVSFTTTAAAVALGAPAPPAPVGGPLTPTVRTRYPLYESINATTKVSTGFGRREAIYFGDVNPNGSDTLAWFEYGTDPTLTTFTKTPDYSLPAASYPAFFHRHLYCNLKSDLQAGQTYYYRVCASNTHGTSKGAIVAFTQKTTLQSDHRYPRYPHARFQQGDHRTQVGRGWASFPYWQQGTITAEVFDDEVHFYAMNYDSTMNTKSKVYTWNSLHVGMPYLTQFWFVPVGDQPTFEAGIAALGGVPEEAYLHYAAGVPVAEYTHGLRSNGTIAGGGDGTFFPAHVSDGTKIRANRIHNTQFGIQGYYYINIQYPVFQQWRLNFSAQHMGTQHTYMWLDTHGVNVVQQNIPSTGILEYPAGRGNAASPAPGTYWESHRAFLATERATIPGGRIVINQADRFNRAEEIEFAKVPGGTFTEFVNGPLRSAQWNAIEQSLANNVLVQYGCAQSMQADDVNLIRNGIVPGNYATTWDRSQMFQYISYLLVLNPAKMDMLFFSPNIETYQMPWFVCWCKGWEYDIGTALAPRQLISPGTTYTREFERARIYIREGGADVSDATAVTIPLPGGFSWRMLQADGTIDSPITTLTLRKGEGVILLKF